MNVKFVGHDRYGICKGNQATVILNNPNYEVKDIGQLKVFISVDITK